MKSPQLAVLLLLISSPFAAADTVYVRDEIYVPLRSGQSIKNKILHQGIRSGTALSRLETNDKSGYTRVRLKSGLEGWIQTQYLLEEPIAKTRLIATQKKLGQLELNHTDVLQQLQDIESDHSEMTEMKLALEDENVGLKKELDSLTELASNVIAIDDENNELKEEHESLLREIDSLLVANQELEDISNKQWFLRGAGVILMGLLAGFLLARRAYHKPGNSDWV